MTKTGGFIILELVTILSIGTNYFKDIYGFMEIIFLPLFGILNVCAISLFLFHLKKSQKKDQSENSFPWSLAISIAINVIIILWNIDLNVSHDPHWDFG